MQYLTVYAFSTENWKRPGDEVAAIMALLEKYLHEAIEKMADDHIALRVLGDVGPLSPNTRSSVHRTQEISQTFTPQMTANICINYGGRMEILCACRLAMEQARQGKLQPDELTEERFSPAALHGGSAGPGSDHPPQRGNPAVQLSAVAVRLCRAVFYRYLMAGF